MDDFLREFHHRRAEESRAGAGATGLWERISGWFADQGMARWAYGAGLAYAAIVAVVLVVPREQSADSIAPEAISHPVVAPVPASEPSQLKELNFDDDAEGVVGEQEF